MWWCKIIKVCFLYRTPFFLAELEKIIRRNNQRGLVSCTLKILKFSFIKRGVFFSVFGSSNFWRKKPCLKKGNCTRLITTSPAILNSDTFVWQAETLRWKTKRASKCMYKGTSCSIGKCTLLSWKAKCPRNNLANTWISQGRHAIV